MRRHFYLVVEDPRHEAREGIIEVRENRNTPSEKNAQTQHQMRDLETGETWVKTLVSIGYYDFDDYEDYGENRDDVVSTKLEEIDDRHLEDAGVDPEGGFYD